MRKHPMKPDRRSRVLVPTVAIVVAVLLQQGAPALAEGWFCTDESSKRDGNLWTVCGIGEDQKESAARSEALENGIQEFKDLCRLSSDCKGHEFTVQPGRTECRPLSEAVPGQGPIRCVRAVAFTVGEKKSDEEAESEPVLIEEEKPKDSNEKKVSIPSPLTNPWNMEFWVGYLAPPLEEGRLTTGPFTLSVGIERRVFRRVGIDFTYTYFDNVSEPDDYAGEGDSGPGFHGNAWLLSIPVYLSHDPNQSWFIAAEAGFLDFTYITATANPTYYSDYSSTAYTLSEAQGNASLLGGQIGYAASSLTGGYAWRAGYRNFNSSSGPELAGSFFGEVALFLRF